MNFTPFSMATGAPGGQTAHYVTGGQFASAQNKMTTQTITGPNGATLGQVVGLVSGGEGGMQFLRSLEQPQQQLITLPISVPGLKPGDPQQTVQIQVLNPNMAMQGMQQPKYQMQIPIQSFQQGGGAMLTVAYAPDGVDGLRLLGNSLPEGLQVVTALQPHDLQQMLAAQMNQEAMEMNAKETQQVNNQTHHTQTILIPGTQQMMTISHPAQEPDNKLLNNNTHNNNNNDVSVITTTIHIKQETCDETSREDGDSQDYLVGQGQNQGQSQGHTESPEPNQEQWQVVGPNMNQYVQKVSTQQQSLPVSLQQFLKFNPEMTVKREGVAEFVISQVPNRDNEEGDVDDPAPLDQPQEEEEPSAPKRKKKYRKKPPKPQKPKPGQVVIATAADGTTLYCCPECYMAYSDKEQLELHLVGHKIERRFICGICGAGLKRKEHLERHKLGHNPDRPFVCSVCMKGFKRKEHLNLHVVIHSGEKSEICGECGKGFYRKDHLRKHARSHQTRRAKEQMYSGTSGGVEGIEGVSRGMEGVGVINVTGGMDGATGGMEGVTQQPHANIVIEAGQGQPGQTICPEITIHVPTTSNMAVPVQISVPTHGLTLSQQQQLQQHLQQHQQHQQQLHEQQLQKQQDMLLKTEMGSPERQPTMEELLMQHS